MTGYSSLWLLSFPGNPQGKVLAAVEGMLVVDPTTAVLYRATQAGTKTSWVVAGTSGGGGSGQSVPVVLKADLDLAADTQTLFGIPITLGSYQVVGAAGSYLVGV